MKFVKFHHLIMSSVCEAADLEWEELIKKVRKRDTVIPRQVCGYLLKAHLKWSDKAIADTFSQERSTVTHAIQTVKDMIETGNPMYVDFLKKTEEILDQKKSS